MNLTQNLTCAQMSVHALNQAYDLNQFEQLILFH